MHNCVLVPSLDGRNFFILKIPSHIFLPFPPFPPARSHCARSVGYQLKDCVSYSRRDFLLKPSIVCVSLALCHGEKWELESQTAI